MKFMVKHKFKTALVIFAFVTSYIAATLLSAWLVWDGLTNFTVISIPPLLAGIIAIIIAVPLLHLHSISYRRASFFEAFKVACLSTVILIINCVLTAVYEPIKFSFAIICFLIFTFLSLAIISCVRVRDLLVKREQRRAMARRKVIIIGAGSAGALMLRELQSTNMINYTCVGFVDDNEGLHGSYLMGVKVLGYCKDIKSHVEDTGAELIIVAIPTATLAEMKRITEYCIDAGCEVKVTPGIYQLVDGDVSVSKLRNVDVCDLLGRDPIKVNLDEVMEYIQDKCVLVTGGGGSIGSELCRQIASKSPAHLIILDIYENNAYDIEQELVRQHPELKLTALIASIRDITKLDDVFSKYRPNIVFHAAAHKHVPLMETSPCEAVKNNVIGTYNVVRCADKYGVERFVQISTDKAVNPTNIMGATKRICEMIIQGFAKRSKTKFVAVRFGNVLGSNGSVIPLFKRQIDEGGPVTVTHKDIIRYFMTIPEAVSLVLQAGAYAEGGEIYVLDMGEQVRIYDLAVNLIKLSGYEPFVDIDIKITGLRPGEKLYEERLMAEEGLRTTPNGLINIANPIPMDEDTLWDTLESLGEAAHAESADMKQLVRRLVDTYHIDEG